MLGDWGAPSKNSEGVEHLATTASPADPHPPPQVSTSTWSYQTCFHHGCSQHQDWRQETSTLVPVLY